jgi:hypothetical protein
MGGGCLLCILGMILGFVSVGFGMSFGVGNGSGGIFIAVGFLLMVVSFFAVFFQRDG